MVSRNLQPPALALAAAAAFLVVAPASAHHSYADFDACASTTLEGEIRHVSWGNPHAWMRIETDDEVLYNVIWFDVRQMRRLNINARDFRRGERIVVTGSAHRDPEERLIAMVTAVQRPSDGWSWSRVRNPVGCDR